MGVKTDGEKLFKEYLDKYDYAYVYEEIIPGKSKVLDFKVSKAGVNIFCEVKDIAYKDYPQVGTCDPCTRIRSEIQDSKKQLREYRENICCLILSSQDSIGATIWRPVVVFGAMLGDFGVCYKFNGESLSGASHLGFGQNGKMRKTQNTTFSAIVVPFYNCTGKDLRVIVYENPFSRKKLPRDFFCGPYDVRWARTTDAPGVVFRGEKVLDNDGAIKFLGQ